VIRWGVLGAYSCLKESRNKSPTKRQRCEKMFCGDYYSYEELAEDSMEKGSTTMNAKANLFRTLVVLPVVVVAVAVALFGVPRGQGEGSY
jgi:hypothetical protein